MVNVVTHFYMALFFSLAFGLFAAASQALGVVREPARATAARLNAVSWTQ